MWGSRMVRRQPFPGRLREKLVTPALGLWNDKHMTLRVYVQLRRGRKRLREECVLRAASL